MLTLARKCGQSIVVGDDIKLTIIAIKGKEVRIAIDAPSNIRILREELLVDSKPSAPITNSLKAIVRLFRL